MDFDSISEGSVHGAVTLFFSAYGEAEHPGSGGILQVPFTARLSVSIEQGVAGNGYPQSFSN